MYFLICRDGYSFFPITTFKHYNNIQDPGSPSAISNYINLYNTSRLANIKNLYQPLDAFKFTLKVSYSLNGSRYFYSYFNWKILYFIVEGKKVLYTLNDEQEISISMSVLEIIILGSTDNIIYSTEIHLSWMMLGYNKTRNY